MLPALYDQAPLALWLTIAAIFIAAELASGTGRLIWVSLGAVAVGLVSLIGRLGLIGDLGLFAAVSAAGLGLARRPVGWAELGRFHRHARRLAAGAAARSTRRDARSDGLIREDLRGDPEGEVSPSRHIIGRIARTAGPFVGGVGRVWIDGLEWTAEVDAGEDLGADAPVRVMAVVDDERLQVAGLRK